MLRFRGSGDIKVAVRAHFAGRPDLAGQIVVDVPAGKGVLSGFLAAHGAQVEAYDLFPEFFAADGVPCRHADLAGTLPIDDRHADLVLCQEGIEHLPDQLHAFRELCRILKPGGLLVLTTPNVSHLRARLSGLLVESELYSRLAPNELDAVWFSRDGRFYFGHLFLAGIQRLRVLAKLAGLRLERVLPVKVSWGSLALGVGYPLIWLATGYARRRTARRLRALDRGTRDAALDEIARLNRHPTVLFGKHLFLEFRKEADPDAVELPVTKHTDEIC